MFCFTSNKTIYFSSENDVSPKWVVDFVLEKHSEQEAWKSSKISKPGNCRGFCVEILKVFASVFALFFFFLFFTVFLLFFLGPCFSYLF